MVLCALHSILQLPKQNTSCLVAILRGRSLHSVLDQHREDLLYICVYVSLFPYSFFFHQEDSEVNTCRCRTGKDQGAVPWHARWGGRIALNWSAMPVPAHAHRATGTPLSAIIPSFGHIPYASATPLESAMSPTTLDSDPGPQAKANPFLQPDFLH